MTAAVISLGVALAACCTVALLIALRNSALKDEIKRQTIRALVAEQKLAQCEIQASTLAKEFADKIRRTNASADVLRAEMTAMQKELDACNTPDHVRARLERLLSKIASAN